MYIQLNDGYGGYGDRFLGAPLSGFKGGQQMSEDDAPQLLTILAGKSSFQPYIAKAMKGHAKTVPKKFLKIVTSVSQVPKRLRHLFVSSGGRLTGGTIDRWTRTIWMIEPPGLSFHTRLEYALHECVHLFATPHAPTQQACPHPCIGAFQDEFGTGFGEGLTQVITEDIMDQQGISLNPHDRPYEVYAAVMRVVLRCFGIDAMARAYFFPGAVAALRAAMDARWGRDAWKAVAGQADAGKKDRALVLIKQLEEARKRRIEAEEARRKQLEELIRSSPKGDFPIPTRARTLAGFGDPLPAPARHDWRRWMIPDPPRQPLLVFHRIGPFAVDRAVLTPQLKHQVKQVVDFVKSHLYPPNPIGVIRIVGHTDETGSVPHNIDLGNRRMEAVRAELHAQLGDLIKVVLVESKESPGKSEPIGDKTAKGRAANRRVDVYVGPPIPKAEPWPQGKKYDWTVRDPNPDDDRFRIRRGIPKPLGGKSVRQFLMDLCGGRASRDTCKTIVGKVVDGGCKGVEALAERLGAKLSDADKEEIQRQCKAAADKPL